MQKVFYTSVFVFFTALFLFKSCGCTQESIKIQDIIMPKASVENIEVFEKKPINDPDKDDRYLASKILGEKAYIKKNYKYYGSRYVDSQHYLEKHPDDGLIIRSSNSDGVIKFIVYTDSPTPDHEFFK